MKMETLINKLNIDQVIEILGVLGSDQDPILYRGVKTEPESLADRSETRSACVIIQYYNKRGKLVKGTLISMLKDRLGL